MLSLNISFEPSLEKVEDVFKSANLKKVLREIIDEISFGIERYSKQVTPVRTGRLRASIGVSSGLGSDFVRAFVATNVNYARKVHDGTGRMKARPFLRWGTEFAMKKFNGDNISWRIDDDIRKQLVKI